MASIKLILVLDFRGNDTAIQNIKENILKVLGKKFNKGLETVKIIDLIEIPLQEEKHES